MEKSLSLNTLDEHIIYWNHDSFEYKKDKIILFVHGLTWSKEETQFIKAVPFFCSRWYDTYRLNLYWEWEKARKLSECTISIHASDIEVAINHFKDKYKKIYLVWHSLGSPSIANANTSEIERIIYWDPSAWMKSLEEKNIEYDNKNWLYILHWRINFILNWVMIKEWMEASNLYKYTENIKQHTSFIFARNSQMLEKWEKYIKEKHGYTIIEWANHIFENLENKLFENTLRFLEK